MKKLKVLIAGGLAAGLIVLILINLYNNNLSVISARSRVNQGIEPMMLAYRVYVMGFLPVADVSFTMPVPVMLAGKQVLKMDASGRTLSWIKPLFSGHMGLESFVDAQSGLPIQFTQELSRSDKDVQLKTASYDQDRHTMEIAGVSREIMPQTYDILSVLEHLRSMNLSGVENLEFCLNTNQKNYLLQGQVTFQDTDSAVIKAQIFRKDKNPYHRSHLTMYLAKKTRNIPVLIKVFASGMVIHARLVSAE